MRTDAKISKRKVRLPNISWIGLLGYDKAEAEPGDIIVFMSETGNGFDWGRVIGRVDAPASGDPKNPDMYSAEVVGYLCCLIVSGKDPTLAVYERWIEPERVVKCTASSQAERTRLRLNWLLSDEWLQLSTSERRRANDTSPWIKREEYQAPPATPPARELPEELKELLDKGVLQYTGTDEDHDEYAIPALTHKGNVGGHFETLVYSLLIGDQEPRYQLNEETESRGDGEVDSSDDADAIAAKIEELIEQRKE